MCDCSLERRSPVKLNRRSGAAEDPWTASTFLIKRDMIGKRLVGMPLVLSPLLAVVSIDARHCARSSCQNKRGSIVRFGSNEAPAGILAGFTNVCEWILVTISVFVVGSCGGDDVLYLYSIAKSQCRHQSSPTPPPLWMLLM